MATQTAAPTHKAKPAPTKVQRVVYQTQFYDDHYYSLVLLCLLLMLVCAGGVLWGLYERTEQPSPDEVFFPATQKGRLVAPLPLSEPALSEPALLDWVVRASTAAYSFNFINYDKAVLNASQYFTKIGYQNYRRALIDAGFINQIIEKKLVGKATPTQAPIILKEGVGPNGIYNWQIQLPVKIELQSSREFFSQNLMLTMLVTRVPITNTSRGVAIAALVVRTTSRSDVR